MEGYRTATAARDAPGATRMSTLERLLEVQQIMTPAGNVWTGSEPDWLEEAWLKLEAIIRDQMIAEHLEATHDRG